MAAALLRHHAGDGVVVRTAGSAPSHEIHPEAIEALAELGLDVGDERPKLLTDAAVRASDVVITMGCGDACPVYPGKTYEDWAIEDPIGGPIERVRRIRDDLDARVRDLLARLGDVSS
jgi:protein-tyrosine-phosphatase